MLSTPKTEHREERHYVGIARTVPMQDVPQILPPLVPKVKEWMQQHYIEAAGPDFFLYKSMNERNELECIVGFSVHELVSGEGEIVSGSFTKGKYASLIYTGDFTNMMAGHMALEKWISEQQLREKINKSGNYTSWGGRTELYLIDPDFEPDPAKWQTEISFLLED